MALVHIFDKQGKNLLAILRSDKAEFWEATRKDSTSNQETFDFVANATLSKTEYLSDRNRLVIQDEDGFFREYIIVGIEQYERDKVLVQSNASYMDLAKGKVIEAQEFVGATVSTLTQTALSGTIWQAGNLAFAGSQTVKLEKRTNPFELLKLIAATFNLRLEFRIVVEGSQIVGRYVDLVEKMAAFSGKEIVFGKDLIGLRRKRNALNIVTALMVYGREQEDGTVPKILVEDKDALARWGIDGQHLVEEYEPAIEEDGDKTLETLGKEELKRRIEALVTYEISVIALDKIFGREFEKIRKGQTVRIKDEKYNPPLYLEAQVEDVDVDQVTGRVKGCKIGNFVEFKRADLEKQVLLLRAQLGLKASKAFATARAQEAQTAAATHAEEVATAAQAAAETHAEDMASAAQENAINYTQENAVMQGELYNGTSITDEEGFVAVRSDGLVRMIANATGGFKIQSRATTAAEWVDVFYADINGNLKFAGDLSGASGTFKGTVNIIGGYGTTVLDDVNLTHKWDHASFSQILESIIMRDGITFKRTTKSNNRVQSIVANSAKIYLKDTIAPNDAEIYNDGGRARVAGGVITDKSLSAENQPYLETYATTGQSIPTGGAWTQLLNGNNGYYWNLGGGTWSAGRYTVPETGWYLVEQRITFTYVSGKAFFVSLFVNDWPLNAADRMASGSMWDGTDAYVNAHKIIKCQKGDILDVRVAHYMGAANTIVEQGIKILKLM